MKLIPMDGTGGRYRCGKYIIRTSSGGGKAGRGKNSTASLQVIEPCKNGHFMKVFYRYIVCDKESYDEAEAKCIQWIKEHP